MSLFESWFLTQNQYNERSTADSIVISLPKRLNACDRIASNFPLASTASSVGVVSLRVNPNLDLKRTPHQFVNKVPTSRICKDLHCSTGLR